MIFFYYETTTMEESHELQLLTKQKLIRCYLTSSQISA